MPSCGYIKVIIFIVVTIILTFPYTAPDDFDNNQHISTKVSIEDEFPFVKHKEEESDEEGNDDGDASGSDDDLDEDDNVEKKKKIKKKSYKKKVKRPRKSESYAFVEMTGDISFNNNNNNEFNNNIQLIRWRRISKSYKRRK